MDLHNPKINIKFRRVESSSLDFIDSGVFIAFRGVNLHNDAVFFVGVCPIADRIDENFLIGSFLIIGLASASVVVLFLALR